MKKVSLIIFSTFLAVLLVIIMAGESENSEQPILYNHKLHTEEVGLECQDCHVNAETHRRASIPNIEVCGNCHDDTEVENIQQVKVGNYVSQHQKIPWIQIHTVPDHAYFSHRRHVMLGKIDCKTCHGNVEKLEVPISEPFTSLEMDWCIECHKQRNVTTDCNTCHR
jgi:hypothetical protein